MPFTTYSQVASSRDCALLPTAIAASSLPGSASLDLMWLQVAPIPPLLILGSDVTASSLSLGKVHKSRDYTTDCRVNCMKLKNFKFLKKIIDK